MARASSSSKDEQKEAGAADPKIGKFDISDMDGSWLLRWAMELVNS